MTVYNNLRLIRRSRVVGRARTIGNRVTIKSGSRVRIPPSPPKQKAPNRVLFVLGGEGFGYELVLPKAKQFVVAVRNVRQHFGTVKSGARTICRAPPVAVDRLESALYPVLSLAKNKIYSGHPTGCFLFWT